MWPSLDWWQSRGFTVEDGYLNKSLPNGWELAVSTREPAIPSKPPIDGESLAIVIYEPDGTQTAIFFSIQRDSNVNPERLLSALLKTAEDETYQQA